MATACRVRARSHTIGQAGGRGPIWTLRGRHRAHTFFDPELARWPRLDLARTTNGTKWIGGSSGAARTTRDYYQPADMGHPAPQVPLKERPHVCPIAGKSARGGASSRPSGLSCLSPVALGA